MVQRKDSLNFMSFIMGRPAVFERMTQNELLALRVMSLEDVWKRAWGQRRVPIPRAARHRYMSMKECGELDRLIDAAYPSAPLEPEWGFPKGRMDARDATPQACALREFSEETGYAASDVLFHTDQSPIVQSYIGSDQRHYHVTYYHATLKNPFASPASPMQGEITRVAWIPKDHIDVVLCGK